MRILVVSGLHMKSTKDSVCKAKMKDVTGGEGGIRTHDEIAPILVFETSALNRSATSPGRYTSISPGYGQPWCGMVASLRYQPVYLPVEGENIELASLVLAEGRDAER